MASGRQPFYRIQINPTKRLTLPTPRRSSRKQSGPSAVAEQPAAMRRIDSTERLNHVQIREVRSSMHESPRPRERASTRLVFRVDLCQTRCTRIRQMRLESEFAMLEPKQGGWVQLSRCKHSFAQVDPGRRASSGHGPAARLRHCSPWQSSLRRSPQAFVHDSQR